MLLNCHHLNGVERKPKLAAYWAVLEKLDPAVIVSVCERAARGEIGNPAFLPSAGELYQATQPPKPRKPPPIRRQGQDRFLASDGTLYIDCIPYTRSEQAAWERGEWPPGRSADHDPALRLAYQPTRQVQ
jgi:hypothetical protein